MKKSTKKIEMIIEKTRTGFSAYSVEYSISTTGKTILDIINNAYEAASFYFEEFDVKINSDNIHFQVDFKQFFQYYKVLNAKFLAEKIGMNPSLLSQYVRGRKKPSENQTEKILMGIHQIGTELAEINLIHRA